MSYKDSREKHLLKVVKNRKLPDVVMNVKAFPIPNTFESESVSHLDFFGCPSILKATNAKIDYYESLSVEALNHNYSNHTIMSVNDLLENENSICSKCSRYMHLPFSDVTTSSVAFYDIKTFQKVQRYFEGERFKAAKENHFLNALFNLTKSPVFSEVALKLYKELISLLSKERFSLKENFVSFNENILKASKSFTHFPPLLNGDVFKKETLLKYENDFIILNLEEIDFNRTFSSLPKNLVKLLISYPNFTVSKFTVLPFLQGLLAMNAFPSLFKNFPDFYVHVKEEPSQAVLETMSSLFTENNVTMRNYTHLYEISKTV